MECERNTYADSKVSEEGWGGGVPEEGMPLQPVVRRQAVPPQPMEGSGGADAHLQPGERGAHAEAGECLKEAVTLWEACAGAGLLAGLVTLWRAHVGAVCA